MFFVRALTVNALPYVSADVMSNEYRMDDTCSKKLF